MDIVITALLVLALLVSVSLGWAVRDRLNERHVSAATTDSIRLLMGMLLTFSALVLGLLTSSAKARFDAYNVELSAYAGDLIELDHRLRVYGAEAEGIRAMLRAYTAAAIRDSWPNEAAPSGQYPRFDRPSGSVETRPLGTLLDAIDVRIEQLAPPDPFHQQIAARLRNRVAIAIQQRWHLILSARSTIAWPFLAVLTSWLAIIFAIFGLTSPRNRLMMIVVGLSALSIASPLYLILDYSDALTGLLHLSSQAMRAALSQMDVAP